MLGTLEILILFIIILVAAYILVSYLFKKHEFNKKYGGDFDDEDDEPIIKKLDKMIISRSKNPKYLKQMLDIMMRASLKYGNKKSNDIVGSLNKFIGYEDSISDPKKFIQRYLKYKKQPNYKILIDMDTIKEIKID